MSALQLIVGLGNPEVRYERTRHNAGFWFLDEVARKEGLEFRLEPRFQGWVARVDGPARLWLLKPQTYMNRSGFSVQALAHFHRLTSDQILVVHDDLDLPPGTIRLKRGGGPGGHNGLRDIQSQLGSSDFYRLRIGIGHPGDREQVANFVLDGPSGPQREAIDAALARGLSVLPELMRGEYGRVMNVLNGRPGETPRAGVSAGGAAGRRPVRKDENT